MTKSNRFCLLLSLLLLLCSQAYTQTRPLIGRIYNQEDESGIGFVSICNITSGVRSVSQHDGSFSLFSQRGDSISVSKIGYYPDTILLTNDGFITLRMLEKPIALEAVTITANNSMSPLEEYEANKMAYKSIYYKGDKKDMIQAIPLGIGININKLFSALSKEGKDARRLLATIEEEYKMDEVDELFNKKLVSEVTGLNGTELEDFMFEHRPTFEWIKAAAPYDIIIYIKEKFKVFLGEGKLPRCD